MTDQKNHDSSTPKSDLSPQVDVNHGNVHETLPPSSASSTNNMAFDVCKPEPSVSTLVDIYDSEAIDPVYQAKSHAISCAIQEIGMGRYQVRSPYRVWKTSSALAERRPGIHLQWWLFVVAGFGWFRYAFRRVLLPHPDPYSHRVRARSDSVWPVRSSWILPHCTR